MTADQLKAKTQGIIGNGLYDTKSIRMRATISGAAVGGVFGLYYGYTKKKNILMMTVAGVVIGGILSRLLTPKD